MLRRAQHEGISTTQLFEVCDTHLLTLRRALGEELPSHHLTDFGVAAFGIEFVFHAANRALAL